MANNKNKNKNKNRNKSRNGNLNAQAAQAAPNADNRNRGAANGKSGTDNRNSGESNGKNDQDVYVKGQRLTDRQKYWHSFYSEVAEILFCGSALVLFIFYFFVKVNMVGLAAVVFLLAGISDCIRRLNRRYSDRILRRIIGDVVLYVLMILFIVARPSYLNSRDTSKYKGYKVYLNIELNTDTFFPYRLPYDIVEGTYKLSNKNDAWGKSSWSSVRFCVETDSWEWERMVYEKGRNRENRWEETNYEGTLTECLAGNTTTKNLRFLYDSKFWEGHEEGTIVMSDINAGTDKKPVSQVIIINPEEGMIEFSQLKPPYFPF